MCLIDIMRSYEDCNQIIEARFECYYPDSGYYRYSYGSKNRAISTEAWDRLFICTIVKDDSEPHIPQKKYLEDKYVGRLVIGWIWYIGIMAVGTIFKGNVAIWIISSICFFYWRQKIREKYSYYE